MNGTFEVATTISMWEPPFDKKKTVVQYTGEEGEEFDYDEVIKHNIFKILSIKADFAIIEFNLQYTLKQGQYSANELMVGPQQIRIPMNREVELSYMWGHKGTTKKIKFIGISGNSEPDMNVP